MSKGITLGILRERGFMARPSIDLLQGSLDVIVLQTLSWQPMHGFGIARWIQRVTDDVFQVEEGSLYPALYRMENKGWVKADWRITENNRRAKYYRLTAAGKRRLADEAKRWDLFAGAMTIIMSAVPATA
jgi:PadR family transcriptional regulator, regulatory protein PadR